MRGWRGGGWGCDTGRAVVPRALDSSIIGDWHEAIGGTGCWVDAGGMRGAVDRAERGRAAVPYSSVGLERVLGQDAAGLVRLFGQPDADVREQSARKLQFQGPICVLDAYLYPKDGREPVVTYLDAREPEAARSTGRAASRHWSAAAGANSCGR